MNNNYPTEPGLYFARSKTFKWWNLIVHLDGLPPMMWIDWAVDMGSLQDKTPIYHRPTPTEIIFGPPIPIPEVGPEKP